MSLRKDVRTAWGQISGNRRHRPPARRSARLALERLECRLVPSVGGGWINSTQSGQSARGPTSATYYVGSALSGARRRSLGGTTASTSNCVEQQRIPAARPTRLSQRVGPSTWSAKWTGALTANFNETYTFRINSSGNGVRLWVTPVGQQPGNPLINHWTYHSMKTDTATMTLQAGQDYAVELDFSETYASTQLVQLQWSSPSTPLEDIEPVTQVGLNVDGGDGLFANMVNGDTNHDWWVPGNTSLLVPTDSNLWPETDAEILLGEGDTNTQIGGAYLVQFTGMATVIDLRQSVDWWVNGTDLHSSTLQAGQGYNPKTNTTSATMVVSPNASAGFLMTFTNTSRASNSSRAITAISECGHHRDRVRVVAGGHCPESKSDNRRIHG